MIKLSRQQRYWWLEPWAFARARERGRSPELRWPLLFGGATVLFFLVMLPVTSRSFPAGLVFAIVLAAAMAAGLAAMFPLLSRLPNDICITDRHIILGRRSFAFTEIVAAVVGTMSLEGRTWPVLMFRTHRGERHVYGLSRRIDANELARYLRDAGIPEGS